MKIHRDLEKLPPFSEPSVITIGSFDGLHHGHRRIIDQVNRLKDSIRGVSIIITFHPHPRQIIYPKDKSLRLLNSLDEKIRLFEETGIDHLVIVPFTIEFSQLDPREYVENFLLKKFNPRYVVIGYDHRFGLNRSGNMDLLKSYEVPGKMEVVEIDKQFVDEIVVSSTKIRKALENGSIELANQLLAHPYILSGTVTDGQKMGSKLGYPTANLKIENPYKLIPHQGIYAATTFIGNREFQGLLYIGKRPSFADLNNLSVEMHLFDFDEPIYKEYLVVQLHKYIRGDRHFDQMDDLKLAMQADEKVARSYFEEHMLRNKYNASEIAITILSYNGANWLEKFLPSISNNCPALAEIYVIDNASTDHSIQLLQEKFPKVRVIQLTKNAGFAGGYNAGLKYIKAKYFYLINSDIEVRGEWLLPLYHMCEQNASIAACQPKILSYHDPELFEYAGGVGGFMDRLYYPFCMGRILHTVEKDQGLYDEPTEIFWASGAALFIRAKIFNELEGFDSDYFAHQEEIDLCWRIKRAGYQIMSCPKAAVYHVGGGTLTYESPKKTYLNFRNNLRTIYKNVPSNRFVRLFGLRIILDSAAAFNYLFQGNFKSFYQVFRGYFHFLTGIAHTRKQKHRDQALIERISIADHPNLSGWYQNSILYDYYFRGKKTFSSINQEALNVTYESSH